MVQAETEVEVRFMSYLTPTLSPVLRKMFRDLSRGAELSQTAGLYGVLEVLV